MSVGTYKKNATKTKHTTSRDNAKKFGDLISCDHLSAFSERLQGLEHEKDALLIADVATGWKSLYPLMSKTTEEVKKQLLHFREPNKKIIKQAYSDRGP